MKVEDLKPCIACAEEIKAAASLCKHCGTRQDDETYQKGGTSVEDARDRGFSLIDAGQLDEALRIFESHVKLGYGEDLIGIAEIAKIRRDKETVISCLNRAMQTDEWLVGIAISQHLFEMHHSEDLDTKTSEEVINWSNQKIRYVQALFNCLNSLSPEMRDQWSDTFLDAAAAVSHYSDHIAYFQNIHVAEMQILSSFWLMTSNHDLYRRVGAKNLYFFFEGSSPGRIGAMYIAGGLSKNLETIDELLQIFVTCEKERKEAGDFLNSAPEPLAVLKAMDELYDSDASKGNLSGIFTGHAVILRFLIHGGLDLDNHEVARLVNKYWDV